MIRNGINHLRTHKSQHCRDIGAAAQSRYDSPEGRGFRSGDALTDPMYVNMANYGGGWMPSDGYIHTTSTLWADPRAADAVQMGGMIAHEEGAHQSGQESPEHEQGLGEYLQASCGEA